MGVKKTFRKVGKKALREVGGKGPPGSGGKRCIRRRGGAWPSGEDIQAGVWQGAPAGHLQGWGWEGGVRSEGCAIYIICFIAAAYAFPIQNNQYVLKILAVF